MLLNTTVFVCLSVFLLLPSYLCWFIVFFLRLVGWRFAATGDDPQSRDNQHVARGFHDDTSAFLSGSTETISQDDYEVTHCDLL